MSEHLEVDDRTQPELRARRRGGATEAAVADGRDPGLETFERSRARDRLHLLDPDPGLALHVDEDPGSEREPVAEAAVDRVLEVAVGVHKAGEDHRLRVALSPAELGDGADGADAAVLDSHRPVPDGRPLDWDDPVRGEDPHVGSAPSASSSHERRQRGSRIEARPIESTYSATSGIVERTVDTGSTPGSATPMTTIRKSPILQVLRRRAAERMR